MPLLPPKPDATPEQAEIVNDCNYLTQSLDNPKRRSHLTPQSERKGKFGVHSELFLP